MAVTLSAGRRGRLAGQVVDGSLFPTGGGRLTLQMSPPRRSDVWAATTTPAPTAPRALSPRARTAAFATIAMGMLLAALDGTIVSTALPTIVGDLGGGDHVSWVVTSYLLAQTAVTVVVGKLGDQFGRKFVFQLQRHRVHRRLRAVRPGRRDGLADRRPRAAGRRRRWPHRHGHRPDRRHHPAARAREVPRRPRRRLRPRHRHRPPARRPADRQRELALVLLRPREPR